jgi:predicted nucleic acid-binding protein
MITICDTGPLLPYLSRNDLHHEWAVEVMKQVRPPTLVCEPVLTEIACFLREDGLAVEPLFQLFEREAIRLGFDLSAHWPRIRMLMSLYKQMDLADASVVVMTELYARSQVLTVDRRDFSVYRRNDRQVISFICPGKG